MSLSKQQRLMEKAMEELKRLERKEALKHCLSADNLQSRPSEAQSEFFKIINGPARYRCLQGGNQSGKTSVIIRDIVWALEGTHPYWRRPTDRWCNNLQCNSRDTTHIGDPTVQRWRCNKCGNIWQVWDEREPINVMLVGKNNKNLFLNLWENRIKLLLSDPEEWHPVKIGPYVSWVENTRTGSKIIFFPHGHGEEQVRESVQGFTIHFVAGDEFAPVAVMEELMRRVDAKMGYWSFAFTMKGRQMTPEAIRFLKAQVAAGVMKLLRISKLDNPVYAGTKELEIAKLAGLSPEQRDAVLYGDVEEFDDRVFTIKKEVTMERGLPSNYCSSWRHVEIIDPALQSTAGYVIIAQNPETNRWHVAVAEYVTGMQDSLDLLEFAVKRSHGYNIVRRVSDNMAWFINAATKRGVRYIPPPHKQGKIVGGKLYLLKNLQTFISEGRLVISESFENLWEELETYRWKEGSDTEIVKSSRYHLIDCLAYFVDTCPRDELKEEVSLTYMQGVMQAHRKKVAANAGQRPQHRVLRGNEAKDLLRRIRGRL